MQLLADECGLRSVKLTDLKQRPCGLLLNKRTVSYSFVEHLNTNITELAGPLEVILYWNLRRLAQPSPLCNRTDDGINGASLGNYNPLNLPNFYGVFLLLFTGCVCACIVYFLEKFIFRIFSAVSEIQVRTDMRCLGLGLGLFCVLYQIKIFVGKNNVIRQNM